MKVVLLKDVKNVGKKGEVVNVSSGYGVNYLIPEGFAEPATKDNVQRAKQKTKERKERKEMQSGMVQNLSNKVRGKKFQIKTEANKSGRLYGSLDRAEIEKELAKVWKITDKGVELEADLAQPVRDTGKYPLDVVISGAGQKEKVAVVLSIVGD